MLEITLLTLNCGSTSKSVQSTVGHLPDYSKMTIHASTFQALGRAEAALSAAREDFDRLTDGLKSQSIQLMSERPLAPEAEELMANWRSMARLAAEIAQLQTHLTSLQQHASRLLTQPTESFALPGHPNVEVQDVKPKTPRKSNPRKTRQPPAQLDLIELPKKTRRRRIATSESSLALVPGPIVADAVTVKAPPKRRRNKVNDSAAGIPLPPVAKKRTKREQTIPERAAQIAPGVSAPADVSESLAKRVKQRRATLKLKPIQGQENLKSAEASEKLTPTQLFPAELLNQLPGTNESLG